MAKKTIRTGTTADPTGDSLKNAFVKVNENFTELYNALGLDADTLNIGAFEFTGSVISTTDSSAIVIDQATTITSNLSVGGDILPQTAYGGDLGSSTLPWRSLYVSQSTIYLGGVPLTLDASNNLTVNGSQVGGGVTSYADLTGTPALTTVATTGSYNDLTNQPTLFDGVYSSLSGKPTLFSGSYNDLTNKPDLAGTYQFSVAADDSTQRSISTDEVIKFIGAGTVTTSSDAEGNITITGSGGGGGGSTLVNGAYTVSLDAAGALTLPGDIRSEGNINIEINLSDSTLRRWQFGEDGNLTLPQGGNISEGGGFTGAIKLTPAGGANEYQALMIYPTANDGDHIHLTAGIGGTTELYLGDDTHYVKVGKGAGYNGMIIIAATGFPDTVSGIISSGNWAVETLSNLATTGGTGTDLTVTVTQVAGVATAIAIDPGPMEGYTANDTITVTSGAATATFDISVLAPQWVFAPDGNLYLPAGSDIVDLDTGLTVLGGTLDSVTDSGSTTTNGITVGSVTLTNGAVLKDTASDAVAFGENAGLTSQGANAVAVGTAAGYTSQGSAAVAIGIGAGYNAQGAGAVGIGNGASYIGQGVAAVAIGQYAGYTNQGTDSVAIGLQAGYTSQAANTIILNASGTAVNGVASQTSSFYVDPIRNAAATTGVVYYNISTKEVTYGALTTATTSVLGGVKIDGTSIQINNGVISLNAGLSGAVTFKGGWNASTNTPTLINGTGTTGWMYIVTVGGTQNLGAGSLTYAASDLLIYDGTSWIQIAANNGVVSFNTRTGAVTLTSGDVTTALGSATANYILAAPNGTSGTASFRAAVLADISNLGTGVATFLATPTSANLASAITDETGTSKVLFSTSPTVTTSILTDSASFNLLNATATTVNFAGAATTLSIGAATGTASVNNATLTLGNATTINVNGASPTIASTSTGTLTLFNTNLLTVNFANAATTVTEYGAATSLAIGNTATAAQTVNMFTASTGASTYNFATGATASATTKAINIGTTGVSGSITNIALGSAVSGATGTTTINTALTVTPATTATVTIGAAAGTGALTFGQSTASQTVNIAAGVTASGNTKTIAIGTTGASGSTTAISIGSVVSGATSTLTFGGTVADATATSTAKSVGYLGLPQSATATTATLTIGDAGKHIYVITTGQTITIPAAASVAYPIGTTITFIAGPSATTVTIAITSDTMRLAGGTSTGSRTLAANGMATAVKVSGTSSAGVWYINGTGLT